MTLHPLQDVYNANWKVQAFVKGVALADRDRRGHWGLLAASMGGLLMFAAAHPEVRPAVVTATLIEKAGIAVAFALVRRRPFARGLRMVAAFDTTCVLLYAAWLVTS